MTLTLWTNPQSRGQIAHWMLEEVGRPYETVWLPYGPEGTKSTSYLAVNPMGKVPALRHDGQLVTEAAAICLYLANAFPEAGLLPPPERSGDYFRWTVFAAGPIEQAVTSRAMGWTAPPERAMSLGFGTFEAATDTLAAHFANNDFVCGGSFTAADVYVGSSVHWGLVFEMMPAHPTLAAYAEHVRVRPAFQRVEKIIAEQMAKQG